MENKKIIIYSRYSLMSNWLSNFLEQLGWEVTINEGRPDKALILLVDVASADDKEKLSKCVDTGVPVVVISRLQQSKLLSLLFDFEIKGIIHLSSEESAVLETLDAAEKGEEYFDEVILTFILSDKYRVIHDHISSLSKRELEIIDGILEDLTNDEIAERFNLSVRTVNAHKRNILQKMDERSLVGVIKTMLTYSLRYT